MEIQKVVYMMNTDCELRSYHLLKLYKVGLNRLLICIHKRSYLLSIRIILFGEGGNKTIIQQQTMYQDDDIRPASRDGNSSEG